MDIVSRVGASLRRLDLFISVPDTESEERTILNVFLSNDKGLYISKRLSCSFDVLLESIEVRGAFTFEDFYIIRGRGISLNKSDKILGYCDYHVINTTGLFALSIRLTEYMYRLVLSDSKDSTPDIASIENVICKSCKCHLLRENIYKIKSLPSEYWHELVDAWSCHNNEFKTKFSSGSIHVPSKHILMGQNQILANTMDGENIEIQETANLCKHCNNIVWNSTKVEKNSGFGFSSDPGNNMIHISKYAVDYMLNEQEILCNDREVTLSSELMERVERHSCFSFILESTIDNRNIYLWILNTDTLLKIQGSNYRKVLIVCYCESDFDAYTSVSERQCETVYLDIMSIKDILEILKSNSETLPLKISAGMVDQRLKRSFLYR